ncbi:hypothetical protein XENTR_v10017147 [Xenopus tropicalis]|nr:hypothetical protein XENTR_v10017147 [Xenopus tropicalis]
MLIILLLLCILQVCHVAMTEPCQSPDVGRKIIAHLGSESRLIPYPEKNTFTGMETYAKNTHLETIKCEEGEEWIIGA